MICGYKVLISVVTSAMVNDELLRRGAVKVAEDEVKARQVANQLSIKDAIQKYRIRKVITFHKSVAAAASFTAQGPEGIEAHVPALQAFHVNGTMASGKRDLIMRAFAEGERTLISNARCLTEGVDVPAVDMVAFLTPKRSLVDIVQATGRAMRTNEATNKTTGYVLVPLYLEQVEGETVEEAVARAEFDEVWAVLQALQEHDEVLAEIIRHMREQRGRTKGFNDQDFGGKVEVLGPSVSLDTLRRSITTQIVDRIGSNWDERYGELVSFKEQHGHCNVPSSWPENPGLDRWVGTQRQDQQKGRLSEERQRRLSGLGFIWDALDAAWEDQFAALVQFKAQHGHCNVPQNWSEKPTLGQWVSRQRRAKNRLLASRRQRLDDIGFVWKLFSRSSNKSWDERFGELQAFKAQLGHCNVPRNWSENPSLATWVTHQRRGKDRLLATQRQQLEALGFKWVPHEVTWEAMFSVLVQYKEQHGDCMVPVYGPENSALGMWVMAQRHRKDRLPPTRRERLEKLGFVWNAIDDTWEEKFAALVQYQQQHAHCNVPQGWPENPALGAWVSHQRKKKDRLSLGQQQRLEALGFVWGLRAPYKRKNHGENSST